VALLEMLSKKLRNMRDIVYVEEITTAKVPILKFFSREFKLSCDLSVYNLLGSANSSLLLLYSQLDPRVVPLGHMVKHWAKKLGAGDASKGGLSSYAFLLMLIAYLQRCSPPVLPVLQELYPEEQEKPEHLIDGWNAWFPKDLEVVRETCSAQEPNSLSVGELWLGFLNYYAAEFDEKNLVVSMRQKESLSKLEKGWTSPCFAIEDPFELSHNLGVGLGLRMSIYIKSSFVKSRSLFGTPLKKPPRNFRTPLDYFFEKRLISDTELVPKDSICYLCKKLGHFKADCPLKLQREISNKSSIGALKEETTSKGRRTPPDEPSPNCVCVKEGIDDNLTPAKIDHSGEKEADIAILGRRKKLEIRLIREIKLELKLN